MCGSFGVSPRTQSEASWLPSQPYPKVDFLIDALIGQDKTAKGQGQPTAHPASSLKTPETHTCTEPIKLQIDVIVSNASKVLSDGRVFVEVHLDISLTIGLCLLALVLTITHWVTF